MAGARRAEARVRTRGDHAKTSGRPAADAAGVPFDEFYRVAKSLNERGVIGRFSTFLEHVKTLKTGEQVTKYNALFHWAVPPAARSRPAGRSAGSTS